ncbi:hypothetical protein [Motilimonas pumila]|uniref:Deubiquitinating enzyme n=1 Tax=Motilimonas pumila TaxID=2303987 RepID=A0A418YBQ9_9GAMM|nr:hypothetical protein [Motilimonas pumila]RJG41866.1 hypothetical protein D1Z90_15960 [Motilimonas pumila]
MTSVFAQNNAVYLPQESLQSNLDTVSQAFELLSTATSLTGAVKSHLDSLADLAKCNDLDSIELLHNIALKNNVVGQYAEAMLYQVYSQGKDNGSSQSIESMSLSLFEHREQLEGLDDNNKLNTPSVITMMASGELNQFMQPVTDQDMGELFFPSPSPALSDSGSELSKALRIKLADTQLEHEVSTFESAKFIYDNIEGDVLGLQMDGSAPPLYLLDYAFESICRNNDNLVLLAHNATIEDIQDDISDLAIGQQLAVPLTQSDENSDHAGVLLINKIAEDEYEVVVFHPKTPNSVDEMDDIQQMLSQIFSVSGDYESTFVTPEVPEHENACLSGLFLTQYSQQNGDFDKAYHAFNSEIEEPKVDTSWRQLRDDLVDLACDAILSEHFDLSIDILG